MRAASTAVLVMVLLVAVVLALVPAPTAGYDSQCERITVPLCANNDLLYNVTRLPNALGHNSQDEAGLEVHQFFPLVKVRCSDSIQPFLCLMYFPECTSSPSTRLLPCRELCQETRDGCEALMNRFGFKWPAYLECNKLPSAAAGERCAAPRGREFTPAIPTQPTPAGVPSSPPTEPSPSPTGSSEKPAAVCPCAGRSSTSTTRLPDAAAMDSLLVTFLSHSEQIFQLQEQNMKLEQQKLQLEIQLLQQQLRLH